MERLLGVRLKDTRQAEYDELMKSIDEIIENYTEEHENELALLSIIAQGMEHQMMPRWGRNVNRKKSKFRRIFFLAKTKWMFS